MRELLYSVLELEEWNKDVDCSFCSDMSNKAVCQIRTRSKATEKIIANDEACESCKEKFENDELLKCKDCGRLQIETDIDIYTGKHVCRCIKRKENVEEKELPILPHERRPTAFYERQINTLQEEKTYLAVEAQTHLDAMEAFEVYNKKHRQELLDEIEKLKKENTVKEEKIKQLEEQLSQLNNQSTAQIEVKPNKKPFLFFGKKS